MPGFRVSALRASIPRARGFGTPRRRQSVPRPVLCASDRRYADAPAAALLAGLGAGEWPPLRSRPCAVYLFVGGSVLISFLLCFLGKGPRCDSKMATHNKLRRQRKFGSDSAIQSQLPNTEVPHSRRYAGKGKLLPAAGVINAPNKGLTLNDATNRIICGDSLSVLRQLPDDWCPTAITSPPYWHTVDYGVPGQIGVNSYEKHLDDLDLIWAEVARVLLPNGKFCLNVPIFPLTKDISESAFGPTHTRVLLDLYSDMKQRIESKTPLRLFSLYIWEKRTTEKIVRFLSISAQSLRAQLHRVHCCVREAGHAANYPSRSERVFKADTIRMA